MTIREIGDGVVMEERDELWRVILDGVHLAEVPDEEEGVAFVHAVLAQTSRADTIDHAFGAVPQVRGSFTPGRRGFPEPALLG
jgi:hypothetical protein